MLSSDKDILKAAEDWRKQGRAVALATVVETWGSAPRPVGSNLVIDEEGNFLGSVSGGCVEGAVVTEALDVIDSGKPRCWNSASPTRPPGKSASPAAAPSGFCGEGGVGYPGANRRNSASGSDNPRKYWLFAASANSPIRSQPSIPIGSWFLMQL